MSDEKDTESMMAPVAWADKMDGVIHGPFWRGTDARPEAPYVSVYAPDGDEVIVVAGNLGLGWTALSLADRVVAGLNARPEPEDVARGCTRGCPLGLILGGLAWVVILGGLALLVAWWTR